MKKKIEKDTPEVPGIRDSKMYPATYEGLRDMLFEELNMLRVGKSSVGRAKTVSQLARRIIEITTLDLYQREQLKDSGIKRLMSENIQE